MLVLYERSGPRSVSDSSKTESIQRYWKCSIITYIGKPTKENLAPGPNKYSHRPIALISHIEKLMEKIIHCCETSNVVVVDRFYIALFSDLLSRLTVLTCGST